MLESAADVLDAASTNTAARMQTRGAQESEGFAPAHVEQRQLERLSEDYGIPPARPDGGGGNAAYDYTGLYVRLKASIIIAP